MVLWEEECWVERGYPRICCELGLDLGLRGFELKGLWLAALEPIIQEGLSLIATSPLVALETLGFVDFGKVWNELQAMLWRKESCHCKNDFWSLHLGKIICVAVLHSIVPSPEQKEWLLSFQSSFLVEDNIELMLRYYIMLCMTSAFCCTVPRQTWRSQVVLLHYWGILRFHSISK